MIALFNQKMEHEKAWLYEHNLGTCDDERSLIYVFNIRTFVTAKGKDMANIYAWDGSRILKIVVFPFVYAKAKNIIKNVGWYAAKMSSISEKDSLSRIDSYKIDNESAIMTVDNYILRKELVPPVS